MKKKIIMFLSVLCLMVSVFLSFAYAEPKAIPEEELIKSTKVVYHKPVAFAVLDRTGQVNSSIFADWKQQVKQAYRIPYYSINDTRNINLLAQEVLASEGKNTNKLDVGTLRKIAEKSNCDVVALMCINEMSEYIIHTLGGGGIDGWDGPEEYVKVITAADLYVYKKDGDKFLKSIVYENDTTDLSLETPPERVIKYAMRRLVNKMENRPQI